MINEQLDITDLYKKEVRQEVFYDNFLVPTFEQNIFDIGEKTDNHPHYNTNNIDEKNVIDVEQSLEHNNDIEEEHFDNLSYKHIFDSFIGSPKTDDSDKIIGDMKKNNVNNEYMVTDTGKKDVIGGDDIVDGRIVIDENVDDKIYCADDKSTKITISLNKKLFKNCICTDDTSICSYKNIIINNLKKICYFSLEDDSDMVIKSFSHLHPLLYPSFVQTSHGSFYLDAQYPKKNLIFSDNRWKIIGCRQNNFFPTCIKYTFNNEHENSNFGSSCALSDNEQFYIIGGYTYMNGIGGAWLYRKNQNKFVFDSELIGLHNIGLSFQGIAVSINHNGSIIAIGGSGDDYGVGACWIFEKYEKYWKQFKLTGSGNIGYSHQGSSINLSRDGLYLIVGGCDDGKYNGACWIYKKCESCWNELVKICGGNNSLFGKYVHISHDNSSFIIGSDNEVFLYSNVNDIFTSKYTIHHDMYLHHNINLFASYKKIFVSFKNIIHVYKKRHSGEFIIKHNISDNNIKKILALCSCGNGQSIFVHGVSKSNEYVLWCFVYVNKKYHNISTISLLSDNTDNCLNKLCLSMSHDGCHTLIGGCMINDFCGCCIVLG